VLTKYRKTVLIVEMLTPDEQGFGTTNRRMVSMIRPLIRNVETAGYLTTFKYAKHLIGKDLSAFVGKFAGVIIPGGSDIDPELYGKTREAAATYHPTADNIQMDIIREAVNQSMPVMGICRGMQLMNVALGGSLHTEIADLKTTTPAHNHYGLGEGGVWPPRHKVDVLDNSDYLTAAEAVDIVSLHHQGVDKLGNDLKVTAVDHNSEGYRLVEAVEHKNGNALAVQWHPEHKGDVTSNTLQQLLQVFPA